MSELSISLFGRFNATFSNDSVVGLKANRLQELLSFLLINRDRYHHREHLADIFWDISSTVQSKKYLRQTIWKLRQSLEACGYQQTDLLRIDGDWVFIDPDAEYWLDIEEFELTYSSVQKISGNNMNTDSATALKKVIPLYKGGLLLGWYHDWCLFERERLHQIYLFMLDKLMRFCEVRGDYEEGVYYGTMCLREDRAQEHVHRSLMRLHYLANNRSAALRQYGICEKALKNELNVGPSRQTLQLYEQIAADSGELVTSNGAVTHQPETNIINQTVTQRIRKLQLELDRIREQITG